MANTKETKDPLELMTQEVSSNQINSSPTSSKTKKSRAEVMLDPLDEMSKELGTAHHTLTSEPISNLPTSLESQENLDTFKSRNIPLIQSQSGTWEEQRAMSQSPSDRFGNMLGNAAVKTLGFLGQSLSQLGGVPSAIAKGDLSDITDNYGVKAFEELNDWAKKSMPDYETQKAKDSNILEKVFGADGGHWWRSEAIGDRLPLALSMFVPGALEAEGLGVARLTGKAIEGAGFVEGLDDAFIAQKNWTATIAGKSVPGVSESAKAFANGLKGTTQIVGGAIMQSALSARETGKAVREALKQSNLRGETNYTDEEIEQKAMEANQKTFWESMPVSFITSAVVMPQMFSSFRNLKNPLSKLFTEAREAIPQIEASLGARIGKGALKAVGTGLETGPFAENMQVAISKYNEDVAQGKETNPNAFTGILNEWVKNFSDPNNGQNNIALGFIQGLLESAFGGLSHAHRIATGKEKSEVAQNIELQDIVNQHLLNYQNNQDGLYLKDEDGKVQVDKNGTPLIDKMKVASTIIGHIGAIKANSIKIDEASSDNQLMSNFAQHDALAGFAYNLFELKGGRDYIDNKLEYEAKKANEDSNRKNDYDQSGFELTPDRILMEKKQTLLELQKIYSNVQRQHLNLDNLKDLPIEDRGKAVQIVDNVRRALYSIQAQQLFIHKQIAKNEFESLQLENSASKDIKANKDRIKNLTIQNSNLTNLHNTLTEEHNRLSNSKELTPMVKKVIDDINKKEKEDADRLEKERKAKEDKEKKDIENKANEVSFTSEKTQLEKKRDEELGSILPPEGLSDEDKAKFTLDKAKEINDAHAKAIQDLEGEYNDKGTINEDPNVINTQFIPRDNEFVDWDGAKKKQSISTVESGVDNGTSESAERHYRYNEKNSVAGNKLLVITRTNNSKLYNKLVDLDKFAKQFEEEYLAKNKKPYEGIYVVIVDEDGNFIKATQDGTIDKEKGELIFGTITTAERIENDEIIVSNKKEAIKEINEFRKALLEQKEEVYLNVIGKSKGHPNFERTVNTQRFPHPIIGRLSNSLSEVSLELPTLAISGKGGSTILKNGQRGQVGKLYAFNKDNRVIDLIPRYVNDAEIDRIVELVKQRMGILDKASTNPSDELDKIIYFGVPKSGVKEHTLGIAKGSQELTLGTQSLTKEALATKEGEKVLKAFLRGKRVNVNSRFGFDDNFSDIFGNKHDSYKSYLLEGETPMFGTDLVSNKGVQFKNVYLSYDNKFTKDTLNVKETKQVEEDEKKVENKKESKVKSKEEQQEDINKMFERFSEEQGTSDDTISPDELNRLKSVVANPNIPLTKEERNWFKSQFPNIPIEQIKGLIDNQAFGQFLNAGRVLVSTEAPKGTLRHEAFHVITQLYLTPEELKRLYKEAKERTKVSTDKEAEELLAEDYATFDNKSILGAPVRNNLFRKIWNFIKDLLNLKASSIDDIYRRLDKGHYLNKPIIGVRQFSKLNRSKISEDKGVTFEKNLLDGFDALFFDVLFLNGFTPSKLSQTNNLSSKIIERVKNKIGANKNLLLDVYEKDKTNEVVLEGIKNYTYILNNWEEVVRAWKERSASIGLEFSKNDVESDVNQEEDSVIDEENKVSNDTAYQEANLTSTKSTMSSQTKMLIRSLKSKKLSPLGLPQIVDFNATYNFLLKNLVGLSSYNDIYNKIEELSVAKPELKELLNRIGKSSPSQSYDSFLFQQQFRQDFAKNMMTSYITKYDANGNVFIVDANKQNSSGRISDSWQTNIKYKAKHDQQGHLIIDDSIAKERTNIEFLNKIGFTLSKETIDAIEQDKPEFFNQSVIALRNYIIEHKGDITNLFVSKERTKEKTDEVSNIKKLSELEATYNPNSTELSFLSASNKTVYSVGNNSGLSTIINDINNAKTLNELYTNLPHLNTISTEGSLWLTKLFDKDGNKIKGRSINLSLHDGSSTTPEVQPRNKYVNPTRKLNKGDKYIQEVTSVLIDGRSAYIRTSDKSTEHTTSFTGYGKNQRLAVPIKDVARDFLSDDIKDIFLGYFKSEFKEVGLAKLANLGSDLDQYNKYGQDFTIFKSILSVATKKHINVIYEMLKEENLSREDLKAKLEEIASKIYEMVANDVQRVFLPKYTQETLNEWKENRISKKRGLSQEHFDQYSIEQLARAFVVNDLINSIEQVKLFIGNMAFYKDLFKRTSSMTGAKSSLSTGNDIDEWLNTNFQRKDKRVEDGRINVVVFEDVNTELLEDQLNEYIDALVEHNLTREEAQSTLKPYTSMDEGDAQGWITLDEWRSIETRMGNPINEKLFQRAQNGEKLSPEEIMYFTVRKYQYAGPQQYQEIYAPTYHKFSLIPLIPSMVKGKNLEKVLDNLTRQQIGYALFKSGSKVGTRVNEEGKANKFYTNTSDGNINTRDYQKQTVYHKFLGLQTETSEPHENIIFGSQFRKLLFSNMFNGGKINPQFRDLEKLLDEFDSTIGDYVTKERDKLVKELGINPETYKSEDVTKLIKLLRDEAKERKLPDNVIEGIQSEVKNGETLLKYKLDAQVNKAKIDSMITSLVNSRLIRQKSLGDALIQVASSGFESIGKRDIGTNDALQFYRKGEDNKTLPAECMIPFNTHFQKLLGFKNHEEANRALKNGEIDEKHLTLIAYRIPTQGINSMEFFTIKEFLPQESSTSIVLPTAIVAKSGSDYDVDKLNVLFPSNNKSESKVMSIAKEILEHEGNFTNLITPNSSRILKNIVDELRLINHLNDKPEYKGTLEEYIKEYERNLKNIHYTEQLKATTKIDKFVKFLGAKDMIGITAPYNTFHVLAQMKGLTLHKNASTPKSLTMNVNEDGTVNVGKLKDVNDNYNISEVLSHFLTAAVDAAKDPFIFDLNITNDTLNTWLYLVHTGVPFENLAYFMVQPITTEYLTQMSANNSGFIKAINNKNTQKEIEKLVKKKYPTTKKGENRILTNEELKGYLKKINQTGEEFNQTQLQVLDDFLAYQKDAKLYNDAIRVVNLDTKGIGKNLDSIASKQKDIEEVLKAKFVNGIDRILNHSIIKNFNQLDFTKQAFSQFYNTQTKPFNDVRDQILNIVNPFGESNKSKLASLISNDLIDFVVQNYGYPNSQELKAKLFDTESVAKQLLALKQKQNKNSDEQKIADNLLIKELYPLIREKSRKTDNLKIYSKRFDTFTANQLTEAFRELKELNPILAKDIMDTGILQSGLNNSPITYLGVIPFEYYNDLVKRAFEEFDKQNGKLTLPKFIDLFIANNLNDSQIAKLFDERNPQPPRLGNGIYGKDYELSIVEENTNINQSQEKINDLKLIRFEEEKLSGYRERTIKNASADATIAIAHDFNSGGERLTKSSVLNQGKLYLPVSTDSFSSKSEVSIEAGKISQQIKQLGKKEITLNIAGNGLYTLKGVFPGGQKSVDHFTLELLSEVLERLKGDVTISLVRTGGQTGFDEAGAKAARELGLNTLILAPKGWTFRDITGKDISDETQFKARFGESKSQLELNLFSKSTQDDYIPEDLENQEENKGDDTSSTDLDEVFRPQPSKSDSPLVQKLIASKAIHWYNDILQVYQHRFNDAQIAVNKANEEAKKEGISYKVAELKRIETTTGKGGRELWKVQINDPTELKTQLSKDNEASQTNKENSINPFTQDKTNPSTTEILRNIIEDAAKNSQNRINREGRMEPNGDYVNQNLIEQAKFLLSIQDKNKTLKVEVVPEFTKEFLAQHRLRDEDNTTINGFWNPVNNTIYLPQKTVDAVNPNNFKKVFIHEVYHSYLNYPFMKQEAIEKAKAPDNKFTQAEKDKINSYVITSEDKQFIDSMTSIYELAKKSAKTPSMYGYTNVLEFMSEITSNPRFVNDVKSRDLSLWEKIVNAITQFLTGKKMFGQEAERANELIRDYLTNLDKVNGVRNLTFESRPSRSYKEKTEEEKQKENESPFTQQYVFFTRKLAELNRRLREFKEGTPEYNKIKDEEIPAIEDKFNQANELQSEELYKELGQEQLKSAKEYIGRLKEGQPNFSSQVNDMFNLIDAFRQSPGLETEAWALRDQLFPFAEKSNQELATRFSTRKEPITKEMIDAQDTDVWTPTETVGYLGDSPNILASTAGSLIRTAQNISKTGSKLAHIELQKEVEDVYNYITKNGGKGDDIYKVFIQEHKGTTVLTKPYLESGEENPNYDKIQNTPELKHFYDYYQKTITKYGEELSTKIFGLKNFIPNVEKNTLIGSFKKLRPIKEVLHTNITKNEELLADIVPKRFIKKLESKKKSRDLGNSLMEFIEMSNNFKHMNNILPQLRILQEGIKYKVNPNGKVIERQFKKSSNPNIKVDGVKSNIYNQVEKTIEMQVLGKTKLVQWQPKIDDIKDENGKIIGQRNLDITQIIDNTLTGNSILRIGLGLVTPMANVATGVAANTIEAVGGRFFGVGDLFHANNIFFKNNLSEDSDINKWLLKTNALMAFDDYQQVKEGIRTKMTVEQLHEWMYSPMKWGESLIQKPIMIARLIRLGYMDTNGKTTEKGKPILDGSNIEELEKVANNIQYIIGKNQGRYSAEEAAILQQHVLYRMISQFRKFIPAAFENRFDPYNEWNNRAGGDTEGFYRTFGKKVLLKAGQGKIAEAMSNLLLPIISAKKALESGRLTELEVYNMRKMIFEIVMIIGSILAYGALFGDKDKDKERRKNFYVKTGLSLINRVSGDLTFFYSPEQASNLASHAIPLAKTLGDVVQAGKNIPAAFYGKDSQYKSGSRKGENKFWNPVMKLTPGINQIPMWKRLLNKEQLEENN